MTDPEQRLTGPTISRDSRYTLQRRHRSVQCEAPGMRALFVPNHTRGRDSCPDICSALIIEGSLDPVGCGHGQSHQDMGTSHQHAPVGRSPSRSNAIEHIRILRSPRRVLAGVILRGSAHQRSRKGSPVNRVAARNCV